MTEELHEQIAEAARILREFGATEVYVFGSAAEGTMDEYSDIDLAASGLRPQAFYEAWARAAEAIEGRETDLIDLDEGGLFVEHLKTNGKLHRVA